MTTADWRTRIEEQVVRWHYGQLPPWLNLLLPLEWGWRAGVLARLAAYRWRWIKPESVGVPVISIGNITTGGTGKTPLVQALAEHLMARGLRVVILSRGHRARKPVPYARALDPSVGDEAYLLQELLPDAVVIAGVNRLETARRAVREHTPDVILHDDGFQYLALATTLNILLIDGERRFGNRHLLPLGPVREPLAQMRRADVVWVTKARDSDVLPRVRALVDAAVGHAQMPVHMVATRVVGLRDAAGRPCDLPPPAPPCLLLSAISRPESFERDVQSLKLDIAGHVRYPGHFWYTPRDIAAVLAARPTPDTPLITTERDMVKIRNLLPDAVRPHVYVLAIRPDLRGIIDDVDRVTGGDTARGLPSGGSEPTRHP